MSEKQDVICLSHREDPDGIVSAVLIKHLFNAEIYLVDYDELLVELKTITKNKNLSELFICDLEHSHSEIKYSICNSKWE